MRKRILALLLAFLMAFSMIPEQAFATDSTEAATEAATETTSSACPTCGRQECVSAHTDWCSVCLKDSCGIAHKVCDTCGALDCTADHTNWCADCQKDDCGVTHVWCETCRKNDCGVDHGTAIDVVVCETCGDDPCTCEAETTPVDNCPYCEDTLAEDGSVIHSDICTAAYVYDGTADVGKYVKLIEAVGSCEVCDGSNFSDSMEFFWDEFTEGTVMRITGWYWDSATTGLWYAVSFYSGGIAESAAEYWPETPWVLYDYTDTTYDYDASLEFVGTCPVCGKPDCSTEHTGCEICGGYDCGCANEEAEVQEAYKALMAAESLGEFESVMTALSEELQAKVKASSYWQKLLVESYLHVFSHFYSTGTEAEFNAHAEKYPEAFAYIQADETLKYYNDLHLERIRYVAANPIVDSTITLGEIVYVTLPSYTNVAPKWTSPVVVAQQLSAAMLRSARAAANSGATDQDGNGVGLSKTYDPATGKIRLEAYSTGASVTTVTETELPADVILVLDLSGSMSANSMNNIAYQEVVEGTAESVYQKYDGSLYVEVNGSYKEVTITGSDLITAATYAKYSGSYTARNLYDAIQNGTDLYYFVNNTYYKLSAMKTADSEHHNNTYDFSYTDANGQVHTIVSAKGGSTISSNVYPMYTRTGAAAYTSYTYTYTDADGKTVTHTYGAGDSVVSENGPDYYVTYVNGTVTRAEALKNAVTTFADQVAQKAKGTDGALNTDDDVEHAIAIVGFSGDSSGCTGVYVGSTIDTYSNGVADSTYESALQDMSTAAGVANVTASIGALKNEQGTYTYCGTEMANGILEAQDSSRYVDSEGNTIRSKVVVIFTDGEPNGNDAYNAPIADTYTMKNTHGATVYTVGILSNGNTATPPKTDLNKFMHYMSSNYKDATSLTNSGNLTATNGGYYLLAANSSDLNNIFSSISSSATSGGSLTKLSETTEIRDIISPYFKLPEGVDASSIELYTADYNGPNNWGEDTSLTGATATIDGKKLSITGFDFSENWVGTETDENGNVTYHGKKLIIEFPLVVEPDFLGGTGVATNDINSGIYDSDAVVEKFDVPATDVALKKIQTVVQDREIYLGNTIDLTDILALYVLVSDTDDPLQITADGVNNAYVDLKYTVTLEDDTVYTYTIPAGTPWNSGTWKQGDTVVDMSAVKLTDTTTYGITCVMTDKDVSTNFQTANGTATIYVRKPQLTFRDVEKVSGVDKVNYAGENYAGVQWLEASKDVETEGTAPELTLTYTPDADCVADDLTVTSQTDFYVNVQVKTPDGTDITGFADFEHECSRTGCNFDADEGEFIIHVKQNLGTLKITKTVSGTNENDTFIFHIAGNGVDMDVTVTGSDSVTVHDLPMGTYTVTEDTSWSWRYTADKTYETAVLSSDDPDAEVAFTNTWNNGRWLNYVTNMLNTFGSGVSG